MNKFKIDDVVLYQNGDTFELGIIKEVLHQDRYRVWYHTGDVSAVTKGDYLHEISNLDAFTVMRKQVDHMFYAPMTCRSVAAKLLSPFEFTGDIYYKLEDWMTAKLEGANPDFPEVSHAYLEAALRLEAQDILNMNDFIWDYDNLDAIVDELMTSYSESPLNSQFIQDFVLEYADKFLEINRGYEDEVKM